MNVGSIFLLHGAVTFGANIAIDTIETFPPSHRKLSEQLQALLRSKDKRFPYPELLSA